MTATTWIIGLTLLSNERGLCAIGGRGQCRLPPLLGLAACFSGFGSSFL